MTLPLRSFIREYNRYQILSIIRKNGSISRIDISKLTGLSQAAITGITKDLIEEDLIFEKDTGPYKGGRRPVLLAINPEGAHVLGVKIELHEINVVIINFLAEVKNSYKLNLEKKRYSPEELAKKIAEAIHACMWESNFSKEQISGVGVGIPALTDSETGIVRYMPDFEWMDVDFISILQKSINHNIYIDNDVNNLANLEHWLAKENTSDNFLVVSLEYGVGAGCFTNGQLIRGHFGFAGEFGHLVIDPDGPLCGCGKKGCIGAFAGINGIIMEANKIAGKSEGKNRKQSNITFDDILRELEEGNSELKKIYAKAGKVLGIGISYLIKIFDPEKIIITGLGVQAGDHLFNPMYESLSTMLNPKLERYKPEILIKNSTKQDWAQGAGTLVLQEIYKSPAAK